MCENMRNDTGKRANIILKSLVECYIQSGEPVGSKTLAEEVGLPLSPATIRHVLSDLESEGYLHSPHTSAGRIPTAKGYRLFVDALLTMRPLSEDDLKKAKKMLTSDLSTPDLISKASLLVSHLTSLAGIVTTPKQKNIVLSHLEFLPLSDNRVLAVIVLNDREIQNRILQPQRSYSPSELQQSSNYINAHFVGKSLSELKRELKKQMQADKKELNQLLQAAIQGSESEEDFVLSGEVHLIDTTDLSDKVQLRKVFEAFNQKRDILHLLDQCIKAEGIQIYIGEESGYAPLGEYSLIGAPYSMDNQRVGVLAVIGPTRMAYDKIIPVVDITARLLGSALNSLKKTP
jgi:heat-inducible transcriptional repressor